VTFPAAAALALAVTMPAQVMAQAADETATIEEPIIEDEMQISGREEYIRYCSVCHGINGKGNGPLSSNLKIPPSDLTQISKKYGGFPLGKVADIIRNGGAVAGHGSRDMPAWGEVFRDHEEPVMVSALIFELALYLDSIQEK
jgi:mono/diheme cytochrome c family protein